jgi:hypothetical protein
VEHRQINGAFNGLEKMKKSAKNKISKSFLSPKKQKEYIELLSDRYARLRVAH